jgi:hypothetical protein
LYLIRGAGLIKIGIAYDVDKRIRSLQTGSPVILELVGVLTTTKFDSYAIEKEIHELAQDYRKHGEWFEECAELWAILNTYDFIRK